MTYLMVTGGLVFLLIGGDFLVRGAVALAHRLSVPPLVIGLTVVAFGTSTPELVVSLEAVISGAPEIAIGNVVGSNIANILLVLGLSAVIVPIACVEISKRHDVAIMFAVTLGFIALCWSGQLLIWQGAVMILLLCGYLAWSYYSDQNDEEGIEVISSGSDSILPWFYRWLNKIGHGHGPATHLLLSLGFIVAGIAGLVVGAHLLIEGSIEIAVAAGVSKATIGLSLIALGTSLPELATSIVAAIRRHGDVAIGNVVGSNLFNILGIMGITSMVRTLPIPEQIVNYDLWVMLVAVILVTLFVYRVKQIGRLFGAFLTTIYLIYVLSLYHGMSGMPKSYASQATQLTTTKHNARILLANRQFVASIAH
ncbi:MAG: calcium/sodium antiporter [Alphaproteobacteria bacterium]|nr:calcium/sodium antiporter [Alphaproteobacteria bacterium]